MKKWLRGNGLRQEGFDQVQAGRDFGAGQVAVERAGVRGGKGAVAGGEQAAQGISIRRALRLVLDVFHPAEHRGFRLLLPWDRCRPRSR